MIRPLDPNRKPEQKTAYVYRCERCGQEIAFIARLQPWLCVHLSFDGPDCGGALEFIREEPRANL